MSKAFSLANRAIDTVSVLDFGAKGDGVTDDTASFIAACSYCVSNKKSLDISDCKLYLASQSASIPSDGLFIQGSGYVSFFDMPTNGSLQTGNSAAFDTVKAQFNAMSGSSIYSKYNGPIFTGKTFSGNNFNLMGFPGSASSSGFKSTTPTSYPGWSIPFANLSQVSVCYFGTHGLWALGGSEVYSLNNVVSMNNTGYGLYVQQTMGVNSPIEYFNIIDGSYSRNYAGNIYLNGVSKQITIDGISSNDAGQTSRTGFLPTTESDIIYPIKMYAASSALILVAENITVKNCYAEQTQGLLRLGSPGPLYLNVVFENNYLIMDDNTKPYNFLALHDVYAYNIKTSNNKAPSATKYWLETSANYYGLDFQELYERPSGAVVFTNYTPAGATQLVSRSQPAISGTIGDGTADTFTYNITSNVSWSSIGVNVSANFAAFLVTANFQSTTLDTIGAYLVYVTKMSSGNYAAIVQSTGTITGFSGAPTLSTAGVLSIPLSANYRAKVTRLDFTALSYT